MTLVALLAATSIYAACSVVTSGRVQNKGYDPAYEYTTFICASYNSQGMCTVQIPMVNEYPECWRLDLENAGKHGSVCVDKTVWDAIKLGDRFGEQA